MNWFDMAIGAFVFVAIWNSGVAVGFHRGQAKERRKAGEPVKLTCTCTHGYGSHEGGNRCRADIKRPNRWGVSDGHSGSDNEIGWEYVPCPCRSYDGPEPLIDVLRWQPPTLSAGGEDVESH